jgi:hypothetical protein
MGTESLQYDDPVTKNWESILASVSLCARMVGFDLPGLFKGNKESVSGELHT